ncbi:MAG TPA: carbamoyl phosphate synthase small subunit, partial [Bacteroidetes bacterium]|nr:carbamoyl phosphate synthase small subunit [Bacteroidota bacterium]
MDAVLVLEDSMVFEGKSFGAAGEAAGEVVFNTGMVGYQEILTDPSYKGQLVTMTYPHIGNTGINSEDNESDRPWLEGFIVHEHSKFPGNWRAQEDLDSFLKAWHIVGIEGIDTRQLTRHIRDRGAMKGIISTRTADVRLLREKVQTAPGIVGLDLVREVTHRKPYVFEPDLTEYEIKEFMPLRQSEQELSLVVYDFGVKRNILRNLYFRGF